MATAGSTSPSLTSTSHTLTAGSTSMPPPPTTASTSSNMSAGAALLESIAAQNRHSFLQPSAALPATSLQLAKETLDAFAGQVSDEQQTRLREAGKKRKREAGLDRAEVLKIRKLHVDGFETGQVWQQAKRIISSALRESRDVIRELEENGEIEGALQNGTKTAEALDADIMSRESASDGSEIDSAEDSDENSTSGEEGSPAEIGDLLDEDEMDGVESDIGDGLDENLELEGEESESDDENEEDDLDEPAEDFVKDPNGLNDPFFSLEDFNKQTQWFEDQDARADPNTDLASDDEEVDWHADPMAMAKSKPSEKSSRKNKTDEDPLDDDDIEQDEDEEDDEAGPTFGDMDLDAPEGESDDEELSKGLEDGLDLGLDFTANDIFYKNFFAPPRRENKGGKQKKRKEWPRPSKPDEAEMERAMNDVRRNLFEDISEHSDSEDALSDVSAGNPKARRSAHERRQAKLAEEIRKLESESVAKRAWTLSGEAAAVDRPINSLLAEDLDFEHAGKPIPVITEEVSESIEELIKRRVLAQEFDEVIRRRPDSMADGSSDARRGLVELDDSKAKQSLAELYEEDHVKKSNPDSYVSKADEKLRQDEKEAEAMWKEISAKLDALSSWHYKPKPAAPSLTVVADVATVSMEDAQPTTAQGVGGGESMIAPQEVYRAGKDTAERREVVAKSGLPVARQEMSREEKLRRRRREKERIRKSGGGEQGKKPLSKKAQEQKDTLGELRKGGVRVINKKGEIVDMDGKKDTGPRPEATSGSFKL